MPVLLDTTVLIDALRGTVEVRTRLEAMHREGEVPLTSTINVEEVFRWLRPREQIPAERLLRGLRLAPLGRAEGERAGVWRREHARRGITLSQSDCLVAAAAIGAGATLATGNPKDFPFAELTVEHWPAGQ